MNAPILPASLGAWRGDYVKLEQDPTYGSVREYAVCRTRVLTCVICTILPPLIT